MIGVELANIVAVQCPQDADTRHHGRPPFGDQEQNLDRGLPFLELLFGVGQLLDIFAGRLRGPFSASPSLPRIQGSNPLLGIVAAIIFTASGIGNLAALRRPHFGGLMLLGAAGLTLADLML
jgi:hypothetical protein